MERINFHIARNLILLPLTIGILFLAATSTRAEVTSASAEAPIPAALIAKVNTAIAADIPRLTAIFKDLHQHPEIAFTETRTAAIVAKELKSVTAGPVKPRALPRPELLVKNL